MNKISPSIKAFIVFVIVLILLGAGYIYLNNKQFNNQQIPAQQAVSTTTVTEIAAHITSSSLVLGKNATIIEAKPFDPGASGSSKVYSLVYMTTSTKDELVVLYKAILQIKGYTLIREITATSSVQMQSANATSTLSVIIVPKSATSTKVTVILGEK